MTTDKKLHLIAGFVIYIISLWITKSIFIAFWIMFLSGSVKELIWDKLFKRGYSSWSDFSYTIIGGYIASIITKILGA